jgi:hypothetical protein
MNEYHQTLLDTLQKARTASAKARHADHPTLRYAAVTVALDALVELAEQLVTERINCARRTDDDQKRSGQRQGRTSDVG